MVTRFVLMTTVCIACTREPPLPAAPARVAPVTVVEAPRAKPTGLMPVFAPEWSGCAGDADCTYVSLGCCDAQPVNRVFAAQAQRALDESGRPHCATKAACGTGPDGTKANTPGRCVAGRCD